ncbi:MAG: transporter, partial [bacterium]|nr:transporter [bacterium]
QRIAFILTLALVCGGLASDARAQSVPTDPTDMSLPDLLDLTVAERDSAEDSERSWHDPSRVHLSYRYLRLTFHGFRDGTDNVSDDDLVGPPDGETYPILQDKIVQEAHTFALGYDIGRGFAASLVVPYIRQGSKHHGIAGGPEFEDFTIHSDGVGDISLTGSYRVLQSDNHGVGVTAGISFPTGSIKEKGDTPLPGTKNQLPYTMQLGSGSWDAVAGVDYKGNSGSLEATPVAMLGSIGWGGQVLGKIRTGKNSRGYRLGHNLLISTWLSARPSRWLEPFLRLETKIWGRIQGNDDDFPAAPFPTPVADPDNFGGERLVLSGGMRLRFPEGPEGWLYDALRKQALSLEYGQPVYQSLNGPQPRERWRLTLDWSTGF